MEAAQDVVRWLPNETLGVYLKIGLDTESLSPTKPFLHELQATFKTAQAKRIAEKEDIPKRTCEKWLRDLVDLEKIKRGLYRKT